MSPPPFDSALMGLVNANPLPPDYAPGELLCVGPAQLAARRPGWNYFTVGGDRGPWYPVVDAAGNPPCPPAEFPAETVAAATIDRAGWPEDDADAPVVVDAGPG